jgi:hypothetical protein
MCGSLESYIKNWPIFMQVVEESRDIIGSNIKLITILLPLILMVVI